MLIITSQLHRVVTAGAHVSEGESWDTAKTSCGNKHSTLSCGAAASHDMHDKDESR